MGRDVVYYEGFGTVTARIEEWTDAMDEHPTNQRHSIRRNVWMNAAVLLLLLAGGLLGITQAFILLAVYAVVIAPA